MQLADNSSADLAPTDARVWINVSGEPYGGREFADVAEAMREGSSAPLGATITDLATGEQLHMKSADGSWISMQSGAAKDV